MSLCLNCMEFTLQKFRYWNIFFIGPYQVSKVLVFFAKMNFTMQCVSIRFMRSILCNLGNFPN